MISDRYKFSLWFMLPIILAILLFFFYIIVLGTGLWIFAGQQNLKVQGQIICCRLNFPRSSMIEIKTINDLLPLMAPYIYTNDCNVVPYAFIALYDYRLSKFRILF